MVKTSKQLKQFLKYKEWFVVGLVISSLVLLAIEQFGHFTSEELKLFEFYDLLVGVILIIEFLVELKLAKNKRRYISHNWFYLLAAIPLPNTFVDLLRGLRLFRIVRLARYGLHLEHEKNIQN